MPYKFDDIKLWIYPFLAFVAPQRLFISQAQKVVDCVITDCFFFTFFISKNVANHVIRSQILGYETDKKSKHHVHTCLKTTTIPNPV